ncbi:uncharacterized protein LOC127051125 [Gopherus flavomarginatus]|uniref:uncharacterized protein LOC127051125 n=1 Tax=Gopherus flavomarginatus TaxID=286002 RepID=UPI0021CC3CD9|nr:uncharacterized protein LOC127051125 [Gopherus flavomarginatus]
MTQPLVVGHVLRSHRGAIPSQALLNEGLCKGDCRTSLLPGTLGIVAGPCTPGGHHRLVSHCWNQPGVSTESAGASPCAERVRSPQRPGSRPRDSPSQGLLPAQDVSHAAHLARPLGCFLLQGSEVRVHQPPEVRASLGGSVLLNCSFSATPKASKLAVTWVRSTTGGSGEVQIYQPPSQVTELRNRVALDSRCFRHQRDASLHLVNLTQHDAGLYCCFIWTSATSSHAGNGTELSVLGEGPGSGVQHWAACGPLGVLVPILLVLHAMVCWECQGLCHCRRSMRSGAQGRDVAGDPASQPTLRLAGKDGAPRSL